MGDVPMTAAAKQPEAPALQMQGSPPGPVQWCANCIHFRPGPIVVQGNTLGGCFYHPLKGRLSEMTEADLDAALGYPQGMTIAQKRVKVANQIQGIGHLPRETLASAWCSQHKQRVGVLT